MNRHLLVTATLVALLAGCSGSDDTSSAGNGTGPTPTPNPASASASASASAADTGPTSALCATVPSLDAMSAVLGEPVTTLDDLPRGPGEAVCEVTGDGAASVQFDLLSGVTDQAVRDQAAEMGATVTELSDPAGGFAYAATAVAVIDGTAYSVQAITFDVITDPNTPEAIERSAGLLRQWLALLGLA